MEKKTAGLLGVLAGIAGMGTAHAAPAAAAPQVMHVSSYADLLTPIPDAVNVLKLSDAELRARAAAHGRAPLERVQYYNEQGPGYADDRHHHHHHHQYYAPPPPPRDYHHHHHHHHQQSGAIIIPVPGIGIHVN
jgi:hypothetical protein